MGIILFSFFVVVVLFVLLGVKVNVSGGRTPSFRWNLCKKQIFSILGFCVIGFGCFAMIPANNVGIRYNPFGGGTQEKTLGEGFYVKNPLEEIYQLSTKINEFNFSNISIQTKDAQFVEAVLQVQARIDSTNASSYFRKYGNKKLEEIKTILANTIQKEFEKVTTTYNIMEVLGEKRNEIVDKTLAGVKDELIKDGIVVERVILVDTDAGADVEQAIKNEAIAKKNVETATYKKEQAEIEGEAKVVEAEKAKEANELLNKTLTDKILLQQFIEKWDGKLPETYAGDDILSIFNLK